MRKITFLVMLMVCSIAFSQSSVSSLGGDNNPTYPQTRAAYESTQTQTGSDILSNNLGPNNPIYVVQNVSTTVNYGAADGATASEFGTNNPVYANANTEYYHDPLLLQEELDAYAAYRAQNPISNETALIQTGPQNRSMADIIPTAGATETFMPAVGDNFYDPGGPGVNYPNCDCITTSTLDGVTEVNFTEYEVFLNFDWLAIYDGTDTSGTVLWDNGPGGINENVDDLPGMIAANGSSTFVGTSGALTFEFRASAVVDFPGFTAEVITLGGGGGGGGAPCNEVVTSNAFENGLSYAAGSVFAAANDFTVPADTDFELTQIVYNSFHVNGETIDAVDINYYDDAGGLPGTIIATELGVVPTSQTFLGTNFGFDISEMVLDISPQMLPGQAGTTTTYWIEFVNGVTSGGGAVFWEISANMVNGNASATSNAGVYTIFDPLLDGVAVLDGICTPMGGGPTNDECAGATPVLCDDVIVGTTADNTDTGGNAAPDEWYSFTGSGTPQVVTVSLCDGGTDYDSLLRVFDACGGNEIAVNDDSCGLQSELSFLSDGTSTYLIMVEGFGANAGNFSMEVTCVDPPPNDDCVGAIDIACGETVVGETNTATFDATAPVCVTGITAPGVWYTFTDDTGLITDYTLSMCDGGTDYDSKITVYSGDCGALACVVDNDDTCGLQSEVSFQGDGSTTYYILVHGFAANTGNFSLALSCTPVPPPNDMIANSIDVDEIGFPYTDPAVAMPAATTEAGNPDGCNIDGANGVWYNFVPDGDGFATAAIVSPAGASFVNFFTADSESATEDELTLVDFNGNQCAPQTDAIIPTTAGQAYYVFVVNTDGITDIVIDGNNLGTNDNAIQGFTYYPNPATDVLNLNSIDTIDNVAIYNILGQQVLNEDVAATSGTLDVSNLAVGAYIMKVSVNGEIGTYKIIKR